MKIIEVKKFSKYPGPRYKKLGDYSGEEFRDDILAPALKEGDVAVDFDGVYGYGSSFLEEAFGGLVRKGIATQRMVFLKDHLKCEDDPSIVVEVKKYISEALSGRTS
ncbi:MULTISPECIES: STAS-like domain-containing protein [Erwiniaceae]|uniref:STAS-like domain-containing protein n=1 Tax=Erwiniaceae TaxID=1903409 RepID=UPI001FF04EB6|nr:MULTISPECIES: STAS-like domain-containing protein [Erwiniaceae]MBV4368166.1 STAS-like domain-containing protein [Erwinia phyllosphaerae]MCT2419161.1 STAS-like domain-containing protein [Pantoea sp. XY16]